MKFGKNNNKLIAEITKINSYDTSYISKIQKILLIVNNMIIKLDNIKKAYYNDFSNILSYYVLTYSFEEVKSLYYSYLIVNFTALNLLEIILLHLLTARVGLLTLLKLVRLFLQTIRVA